MPEEVRYRVTVNGTEQPPDGALCKCGKPATYMVKATVPDGSPYHEIAKQQELDFEVLGDGRILIRLIQCSDCVPLSFLLFGVVQWPATETFPPDAEFIIKFGETLSTKSESDLSPAELWFVEHYRKKKQGWFAEKEIIVEGTLEQLILLIEDLERLWFRDGFPVWIARMHQREELRSVRWTVVKAGDFDGTSDDRRQGIIEVKDLPGTLIRVSFRPWHFPDRDLFWQMADEFEEEMKRWGFKAVQPTFSEDEATTKRGPTIKIQERAKVCKELKDAHPEWTQEKLAMEAGDRLGEILSAESVRNVYRTMGWKWKRGERTR